MITAMSYQLSIEDSDVTSLFDQSPAHASHGEGTLNAFNMNLTPGGKDKKPQTDTYYPPECTIPERGQVQHLYNVLPAGWDTRTERNQANP